jgi:hypothetical protein
VLYKIKSVAKKSVINKITTIPQFMDAQILKFPNSKKIQNPQTPNPPWPPPDPAHSRAVTAPQTRA